jgi:hypothetical protein
LLSLPSSHPADFNPADITANSVLLSLLIPVAAPAIGPYEASVQNRLALQVTLPFAMAAAAYHPTALDSFGAGSERRRCNAQETYLPGSPGSADRQVAVALTIAWAVAAAMPKANIGLLKSIFACWSLDFDVCTTKDCSDISTPWGLARSIVDAVADFFRYDGSALSTLSLTLLPLPTRFLFPPTLPLPPRALCLHAYTTMAPSSKVECRRKLLPRLQ